MQIRLNTDKVTDFPHYWEMCVGSCHAYTALREDYRKQIRRVHKELGMKYVRFHGLFDDDMCVCVKRKDHSGKELGLIYNFINIDKIFDFLLSIGMKPFVELGFMPSALASGEAVCFHYKGNVTPPADYEQWGRLIRMFTEHLVGRYGKEEVESWFFEVWNEPNLKNFFTGTKEEYFKLYEVSAREIKKVDARLKVGGPATSCNSWITDMIQFCEVNSVPLDFVSTHHYPTDDPLWSSGMDIMDYFKSIEEKGDFGTAFTYERGIIRKMTERARKEAGNYPLYYTEWNTSAMTRDNSHDECFAASMVAKILADNDGLVDGYSYWTFTDIFEEGSQIPGAFHGGFGLQTCDGIAKPAYRIFELFHGMGDKRIEVEISGEAGYVEAIASETNYGYRIILYNHNIPGEEMYAMPLTLDLSNLNIIDKAVMYRIDEAHTNPRTIWSALGESEYLTKEEILLVEKASELSEEVITARDKVEIIIAEYGVIALDLFYRNR